MDKVFYKLYLHFQKKKTFFFIVLITLSVGLAFVASKVSFEEDISKLIPSHSENKELQKVLKQVRFADKVVVTIKKESGTTESLIAYASALKEQLLPLKDDYIDKIQGAAEEESLFETMDFVYNNLPLFLSENDYEVIRKRISEDSISEKMKENYKTLTSPSGFFTKKQTLRDPLHVTNLALNNLKNIGVEEGFKLKDGYIMTEDEQHILLFITPSFASSNSEKNAVFTEKLYQLQKQLNAEFESKVASKYYGAAFIAAANAKQIKQDILITIGIALTVLLIVFIVFYRSFWVPLILIFPTFFGALTSIAFLVLLRSQLSAISLGIGAILLGITLDYALHILTHIKNGEQGKELYKSITKPILMSSLTTALAFLCLLFVNSQALQDLGIFAAVSVVVASVVALLFIPQVYQHTFNASQTHTEWFSRFANYPLHKKPLFISVLVLLILVSCFSYNTVGFNKDLEQLNYKPEQLVNAEKELQSISNSISKSVYVVAYDASLEKALQHNDSIYHVLQALQKDSKIEAFKSVGRLISSEKKQQSDIQKWNRFWHQERLNQVSKFIEQTSTSIGFKTDAFSGFNDLLRRKFKPLQVSDYPSFGSEMISDFISEERNFSTVTSIITLQKDQYKNIQEAFKGFKNTVIIDRKELNETLLSNLQRDFNTLIFYCLGIVILSLLLFYQNWRLALVTTLPICLTWLLTIGLMGMLRLEFNVFNSIISAFIFGLGVDYSIFITNALLQNSKIVLTTHKTAILLSLLTTILGVGVLIFAKHPALHSVALVSMIGVFSAVLIAFTIQPLLFKLLIFKKEIKHNGNN